MLYIINSKLSVILYNLYNKTRQDKGSLLPNLRVPISPNNGVCIPAILPAPQHPLHHGVGVTDQGRRAARPTGHPDPVWNGSYWLSLYRATVAATAIPAVSEISALFLKGLTKMSLEVMAELVDDLAHDPVEWAAGVLALLLQAPALALLHTLHILGVLQTWGRRLKIQVRTCPWTAPLWQGLLTNTFVIH